MSKKISTQIGFALAQIQDTFDLLMELALKKLSSVSKNNEGDKSPIKKAAAKTGSFLGEVGVSFYEEYESIKRTRKQNESKTRSRKKN